MARILLIEDDPDVLQLMEHVLLDYGHDVATAETVAIARILLAAQPFDLAICDVNLPDGSGLDVADAAKARGIEALVVTGYGLTIQAGVLSAYDYLLKPLRGHELIAGIERRLTHRATMPQ